MSEVKDAIPNVCGNVKAISSGAMLDVFVNERMGATLNPQARFIFEHINGSASVAAIIQQMADEYDGPLEIIEQDVVQTILEMREIGLITW